MAPPFLLFLLSSFLAVNAAADGGSIGLNYGRIADNLPSPPAVVQLLKSQGITKVKLFDTNSQVLTSLSHTDISVTVALPNEMLADTAADQTFADNWVRANISKFYPATKIDAIAVGNEVFVDPKNTTPHLVPAMKNVHNSLLKFNLTQIKISSPIALSALQNSYPASSGSFKPDLIEPVIKPMLSFLQETGSYLMVNAYPFFAYSANADQIPLDYALFKPNSGVVDSGNGLRYSSLMDAQLDAVFAAMSAIQYGDIKMVVTETGWPSMGDSDEIGASHSNAQSYNGNLVNRVLTGKGTPLRPNEPLNVFLFALFNENKKTGPTSERNYGLFYPNQQKVYEISLTSSSSTSPAGDSKESSHHGDTWCVANGKVGDDKLKAAMEYACGEGGADCRPIQEGATCYDPNTVEAHASYVFNSYYQKKQRIAGTCDFGGAAYVVTQPPSVLENATSQLDTDRWESGEEEEWGLGIGLFMDKNIC
ncbi:Glucan endo-1,3-beta-glucosidase 13 [Linum perenne]